MMMMMMMIMMRQDGTTHAARQNDNITSQFNNRDVVLLQTQTRTRDRYEHKQPR